MSYSHMIDDELLDLADDMSSLVKEFATRKWSERYVSATKKLAGIDRELLSRMPEGEFITLYGWEAGPDCSVILMPIGFEPDTGRFTCDEYYYYVDGRLGGSLLKIKPDEDSP